MERLGQGIFGQEKGRGLFRIFQEDQFGYSDSMYVLRLSLYDWLFQKVGLCGGWWVGECFISRFFFIFDFWDF